jgi:hypothetical protein
MHFIDELAFPVPGIKRCIAVPEQNKREFREFTVELQFL